MTVEERVRDLERKQIEAEKLLSNLNGKVTVIIAMNLGILLAVAFLAFKV
jgi:hypothetical protein